MLNTIRATSFLALLLVMVGNSFAQIPNAGFETWANGDPGSWTTNNGLYTFVTQASSARNGSSAAQGGVVNVGVFNMSSVLTSATNSGTGFPVSQRYGSLRGYYKFTPVGGDVFFANILAQKGTSGVGAGSFVDTSTQTVYREFVAPIIYPGTDVPDNAVISFSITHPGGFPNVGSIFVVDDLTLGATTGISDLPNAMPKAFGLGQNYPNPFNPTTTILYEVPEQSRVILTVTDLLGREVGVVVNQVQSAGRYKAVFDASALTSGVYYYRLTAGSFVKTNKMVLVR
jgi:hypothetical protein